MSSMCALRGSAWTVISAVAAGSILMGMLACASTSPRPAPPTYSADTLTGVRAEKIGDTSIITLDEIQENFEGLMNPTTQLQTIIRM